MTREQNIAIAFGIAREFIYGNELPVAATARCGHCGPGVPFVTPVIAARLDLKTVSHINRRVENGELHFRISDAGAVEICLTSLIDPHTNDDGEFLTMSRCA